MLKSDMNVRAGKEHTESLSSAFEMGVILLLILHMTLGLEQKPIKMSRGQINEHICPETTSSGRKQASLKVFS